MTQGVAFQPTDEQRRTVKVTAGLGVPHDGIAVLLEIDPKTLRKYFHAELERGSVEATAKVAQSALIDDSYRDWHDRQVEAGVIIESVPDKGG